MVTETHKKKNNEWPAVDALQAEEGTEDTKGILTSYAGSEFNV